MYIRLAFTKLTASQYPLLNDKLFLHFTCRDLGLDIHETLLNDRRESARWDEGAVDVGLRDQGLGAEDKSGVSESRLLEVAVHQEVDLGGES